MSDLPETSNQPLLERNDGDRIPILNDVVQPDRRRAGLDEDLFGLPRTAKRPPPAEVDAVIRRLTDELVPLIVERARAAVHESLERLTEQALERAMHSFRDELEPLIRKHVRTLRQDPSSDWPPSETDER